MQTALKTVVIGAGQAGLAAVAKLRQLDNIRSITLIGDEALLPYQRPPLSKKFLLGEMSQERLLLRPSAWFEEQNIDVLCSAAVRAIQCDTKQIFFEERPTLDYDQLLLTTGARPRQLPAASGGSLKGVYTLRSTVDVEALQPHLVGKKSAQKLLIIGGGYIGLEVAAISAQLGHEVTIVERGERILQRVAAQRTSDFFRALHQSKGVTILEDRELLHLIDGGEGQVVGAQLADGLVLDADVVLVGIGVIPNDELAQQAGLTCTNGIVVDGHCRTSDRSVFAAGDCANFEQNGERLRLESVPHAIHQAEVAAHNMVVEDDKEQIIYKANPWFWSDQYDVKLQIAGLNKGYDDTLVRKGKREGAQSIWYYKGDCLLAVDAMNDAPCFMTVRRILEAGHNVPKNVAKDPMSDLKEWIRT